MLWITPAPGGIKIGSKFRVLDTDDVKQKTCLFSVQGIVFWFLFFCLTSSVSGTWSKGQKLLLVQSKRKSTWEKLTESIKEPFGITSTYGFPGKHEMKYRDREHKYKIKDPVSTEVALFDVKYGNKKNSKGYTQIKRSIKSAGAKNLSLISTCIITKAINLTPSKSFIFLK